MFKFSAYILKLDNWFLIPTYTLFEYFILSLYYLQHIEYKNRYYSHLKKTRWIILGLLLIGNAYAFMGYYEPAFVFSLLKAWVHLLILFMSLHVFVLHFKTEKNHTLFTGMLIYYTGSLFVFYALKYPINLISKYSGSIWIINGILALFFYTLSWIVTLQWKKT